MLAMTNRRIRGNNFFIPVKSNKKNPPFKTTEGELIKEKPFIYGSVSLVAPLRLSKKFEDSIRVLYDPNDPKKFVIANNKIENYLAAIFISLICLAFAIIGACGLLGYIKMN